MSLNERGAIITGAARGIGRACAERFLADDVAGVAHRQDVVLVQPRVCGHNHPS